MGMVRGPAETVFVCRIFLLQLRLEFAEPTARWDAILQLSR